MKRAGIIGWPVTHSLSPVLHGYWLKEHGIDGAFEKIAVAPGELTREKLEALRGEGFTGFNVTVPHKEAAFALADKKDAAAGIAGAANLLVFRDGNIEGGNTDCLGLAASLREEMGELDGKTVILLGAGGAARGALIALQMLGAAKIHLLNRNADRAAALVSSMGADYRQGVIPGGLADWKNVARDAALVVNSTSAGMSGNPPLDIDLSALPKNAVVCDIVYKPLETPLLKDARARGLATIDGLGMLMHQAVPSFEAFFGVRPAVTPGLRAALGAALGQP